MSGSPVDKVEILVGPFPVDASLMEHNGQRSLLLRPQQTFDSAVRHIRHLLPDVPQEAAERLVREQCPEFKDFDELLGVNTAPVPRVERVPVPPVTMEPVPDRGARRRRAFLVAALLPALAASWAVGRYTNVADNLPDATASAPDATSEIGVQKAPFTEPKFTKFAGASQIDCDPISTLEAECTDADGMVMSTKAATGPDSTIFTFSYGTERIGLRIFYDAEYAATWARQDGTKELYPHLRVHGRYVLWGTDPERIKEYGALLTASNHVPGPRTMGGITALPPRLAALTLGTLGLNSQEVNRIMAAPAAAATDTPVELAARMVLGLDTAPPSSGHEGDDIVALAVGIGPNPPVTGRDTATVPVTSPPVIAAVGQSGSTPPTTETSPTPDPNPSTVQPPADPGPAPEPAEPTPVDPPPAETAPTDPQPPAEETPKPPAETPEPPVEESPAPPDVTDPPAPPAEAPAPPVEEAPAPPVVEDPAPPVEETPAPPAEETPGSSAPAGSGAAAEDDLLIVDSAWTVAA